MPDIIRREPFGLNPVLRHAMEQFFDEPFFRHPMGVLNEEATLALDIAEAQNGAKKEVVVRADLPGFTKDEVGPRGRPDDPGGPRGRATRSRATADRWYRRERSWGSLSRRVALPGIGKDPASRPR
ncbi:MAG: Hsp20/alpha crystallin family protein [Chloroflexota bacterium]